MEIQFLDWLQTLHIPFLDSAMIAITSLGNVGILWIVMAVILLLCPKTRKAGVAVTAALVLELFCCNVILKPLVARPRPFEVNTTVSLLISRPADYSFPSGHTGASFAVASALFFRKNRLLIPVGILAVLISFSRLYLYVHYPSDVLAGALLGILSGWAGNFCVSLLKKTAS